MKCEPFIPALTSQIFILGMKLNCLLTSYIFWYERSAIYRLHTKNLLFNELSE